MKIVLKQLLVVLLLLSLITTTGFSQKKNSSPPFIVIQVTDPQFGMYEADKGFSKETELYERAVDAINKLNPDFVVLTGDLVNKKDDRAQVTEFKRITARIKKEIPVYYSPGNHDIGQPTTQKDIDSFISDYGHDRFSFKHKKSLIIGVNSCLIKSNTPVLEESQFEWLKKELNKGKKAKNVILFTHYPFFINSFDEADQYFNITVETRKRYLELFKEYGVDAVFAGHLHNNGSGKYGDMQMITTSAVGKPLGKADSGIRVIKVYPDRVESVYYTLNEIPFQ
ncbi:MAG: metallophosphoesterase [Bacteroidales bacterium]|nr:metallophosphoesterase [Bacteroidales bacterium]